MNNIITWYSEPIKTISIDGKIIQYANWNKGYRVYSVNGKAFQQLSNYEFSNALNTLEDLK